MTFGAIIRDLRIKKGLTQRELAGKIDINFTYLSKIENDKLKDVHFPSEDTIIKLARELDANIDELLLLAQKVPDAMKKRMIERPDAFRKFASLDDATIDKLLKNLDK